MPFFRDKPLSRISSFDIERYKKSRVEASAKVGTVNRELAALSHLFTKAVEWNWIDKRPATIKRFKEDNVRIVYLTVEQMGRLLEAATHSSNYQIYPFIRIGLDTSMRPMEILSMKRENVDPEQ